MIVGHARKSWAARSVDGIAARGLVSHQPVLIARGDWVDGGDDRLERERGVAAGLSLTGRFYERCCTDLNLFHA